jgi:hypothetical protein
VSKSPFGGPVDPGDAEVREGVGEPVRQAVQVVEGVRLPAAVGIGLVEGWPVRLVVFL